jgi:hypothetical protein
LYSRKTAKKFIGGFSISVSKKQLIFAVLAVLICVARRFAENDLLYFEGQMVGGYSSQLSRSIDYSIEQREVMQRPSLGFDYVKKFSQESGDIGTLAIQSRLVWNSRGEAPQLYNGYFKLKTGWSDLWIGHERPAMGLSSYYDTHAPLLPTLVMSGYGFDRDWGVGSYKDFDWGNVSTSLTVGSGMGLYLKSSWLASARISKGVLNRDNYQAGISASRGDILDVLGTYLLDGEPKQFTVGGFDCTFFWNNFENRFEFVGGKKLDANA